MSFKVKDRLILLLYRLAFLGACWNHIFVTTSGLKDHFGVSQQTISRWIRELETLNLITRRITKNGQYIKITDNGISLLKELYLNLNRIFSQAPTSFKLCGVVFTGFGEGAYYMSVSYYLDQFSKKLGFRPYPGTLNLHLCGVKDLEVKRLLKALPGIVITGFSNDVRTYGGAKCFKGQIDGVECALVLIERTHYGDDVVEIVAPVKLRDTLKLTDGDVVEFIVYVNAH